MIKFNKTKTNFVEDFYLTKPFNIAVYLFDILVKKHARMKDMARPTNESKYFNESFNLGLGRDFNHTKATRQGLVKLD